MSPETSAEELKAKFVLEVGKVVRVVVFKDRESGQSKGTGKVDFTTEEDMQYAIHELNGSELNGQSLTVREFVPLLAQKRAAQPDGPFTFLKDDEEVSKGNVKGSVGKGGKGQVAEQTQVRLVSRDDQGYGKGKSNNIGKSGEPGKGSWRDEEWHQVEGSSNYKGGKWGKGGKDGKNGKGIGKDDSRGKGPGKPDSKQDVKKGKETKPRWADEETSANEISLLSKTTGLPKSAMAKPAPPPGFKSL